MSHCQIGIRVIQQQADALKQMSASMDINFSRAVDLILASNGKLIVTGMGKSGLIGAKISATLASTGTPSFFLHPAEAYHGDLGMIEPQDVVLALSNSGETEEVVRLLPYLSEQGSAVVAFTGNAKSTLAKASACHVDVGVELEACPLRLAPTTSTTAALVMGDALAVALMEARSFKPEQFARFHPGGTLGRMLLGIVDDEMLDVSDCRVDGREALISDVITKMCGSSAGICLVERGGDVGLITDGDIRRALESSGAGALGVRAQDVATFDPCIVEAGTRITDAVALMENKNISLLLVAEKSHVVGVIKK